MPNNDSKKYEITDIQHPEYDIFFRIRALKDIPSKGVKKGDLGGYVQSEHNLSHDGSCWIGGSAIVCQNAQVCDDAYVLENAKVFENAKIIDDVRISGNDKVFGNVVINVPLYYYKKDHELTDFERYNRRQHQNGWPEVSYGEYLEEQDKIKRGYYK